MRPALNTHQLLQRLGLAAGSLSSLGLLVWSVAELVRSSSLSIPWDLAPLLVSLGFWIAGLAVWFRGQSLVIVLYFFIGSGSLAAGLLSAIGNELAGRSFYILLAWLAPVLFRFHLVWAMLPVRHWGKRALVFFYLLAIAWSLPFALYSISELQQLGWFPFLRSAVRFTVAVSLVGVTILVIKQLRKAATPASRYRIRFVFSGMVLAFAPLLLLSLIPDLMGAVFIPYPANFAWLLLIPLSYGYSMTGPINLRFERVLSRGIVYYLAAVLFAGGYLVAAEIFRYLVPGWANFWAWALAGLGMLLLFLLVRVNQLVRRLAGWILYGSETSHLELLAQMTGSLGPVMDRGRLRQILVGELASTVPLSGSILLLKGAGNGLVLEGFTGFDWQAPGDFSLPEKGALAAFLKEQGAIVENEKIRASAALARPALAPEEHELLSLRDVGLWIPLLSADEMHGLLILGCKPGGVLFDAGDRQVWLIFARQAGVAAYNLLLAEDLRASRAELARAHQRLIHAREQERRRIAVELHDNAVQQLLGVSYQAVALRQKIGRLELSGAVDSSTIDPGLDSLRREILRVASQLRELIGELRPAGLEEFGIEVALEGFVRKVQRQAGRACPHIEMAIDLAGCTFPEPVEICLFRISQEALRNAMKHANARRIKLRLYAGENEVVLEIHDDGCGFPVPDRLSELTRANHYGLVGIAERVNWVNGQLHIRSRPGLGTQIQARIPLTAEIPESRIDLMD